MQCRAERDKRVRRYMQIESNVTFEILVENLDSKMMRRVVKQDTKNPKIGERNSQKWRGKIHSGKKNLRIEMFCDSFTNVRK